MAEPGECPWSEKVRRNPHRPIPLNRRRGAEVILNSPLRRRIFFGGLVGAVVLVLVLGLLR
jgi:hypothetical protein